MFHIKNHFSFQGRTQFPTAATVPILRRPPMLSKRDQRADGCWRGRSEERRHHRVHPRRGHLQRDEAGAQFLCNVALLTPFFSRHLHQLEREFPDHTILLGSTHVITGESFMRELLQERIEGIW